MHEDKFEKQVREKMEQLGFDPADAVWSGVSKEINREKNRRIPLFWLFMFSGLVLAGGGYYLAKNVRNEQQVRNAGNVKNTGDTRNGEIVAVKDPKKTIALKSRGNANGEIAMDHFKKENNENYHRDIARINEQSTDHHKNQTETTNEVRERNSISATGSANISETNSEDQFYKVDSATAGKRSSDSKIPAKNPASGKELTNANTIPVIDPITGGKSTNKKIVSAGDSATDTKTAHNKKQKKWEIGFAGQVAFSDIQQGSFASGPSVNNPGNVNASPGTPAPAAGSQVSKIRPGFSFGAGVFANRNLTQRISLSAGISYHYYSTHVQTGGTANSAAYSIYGPSALSGNYYLNGSGQSYTGNYHFLELPVSVNFQLNKSHKLPIVLDAGLSFAYLLNSNALFFDPTTDLYVKNPQAFNKTQLNATTALMFAFHMHPAEIRVGPQFQYGLTGLTKEGYGASEHLLIYGMKICFIPLGK